MEVQKKDIGIIQEYMENNDKIKNVFIKGEFPELKEKFLKKISNDIVDEIHKLRGCVIPNADAIKEKLNDKMDMIIDDYCSEIDAFVRIQNNKVNNNVDHKSENIYDVDKDFINRDLNNTKSTSEIAIDKRLINKGIDNVISHIGFKNQNNPDYHQFSRIVENVVRDQINKKTIKFKNDLDQLYDMAMVELNKHRDNFLISLNQLENSKQDNNENISMENNSKFLSLEGIFDEPEISENEAKFK